MDEFDRYRAAMNEKLLGSNHLGIKQCAEIGINREEFLDAFNVALVVGGSITIPHLRRAIERVDQLLEDQSA